MPRAYSNDLRERVAASVASGRSCRETAALFGVSVASVVKWSQRWRATGTAAARPVGGKPGRRLETHRDWLLERLASTADLTVRSLAAELRERGVSASHVSIWRVLRDAGFSFKKKRCLQASRIGRRSPGGAPSGRNIRDGFIPSALSSLTRPGQRPTWLRSGGGDRAAANWSPRRPMASGVRSRFWRPCAAIGSWRLASSMARSMGAASRLMSNNSSCLSSTQATSLSWTISAAIRARPCAKQSDRPAQSSFSCRPTAPTSTPSSKSSPSLNT